MSVRELNQAVSEAKGLIKAGREAQYDLGKIILRVHDFELWKARQKDGSQAYSSLVDWAEAELEMSRAAVYNLKKVVSHFDRRTFLRYGEKKLRYVVEAPEMARSELIEALETGATASQLYQLLGEVRGTPRPMTQRDIDVALTTLLAIERRAKQVGFKTAVAQLKEYVISERKLPGLKLLKR